VARAAAIPDAGTAAVVNKLLLGGIIMKITYTERKCNLRDNFKQRVEKKLSNKGFTDKAPAKLVEEERATGEKYRDMLAAVSARLESLSK